MKTIVFCDDCWHPGETVRLGLASLCAAGFDFEFPGDDTERLPEILRDYSMILLAKANMISGQNQSPWLTADLAAVFQDHLRRGGGLVVVHAGVSRYESSPVMRKLMGGAFLRHPDQCAVTLEPQSDHPLTSGVTIFTVCDEHYFMTMFDSSSDVFLYSRSEHGTQPAGWTRVIENNGRVCVLTPGHNLEVWQHPEFQKLLLNALRWAAKLN